MLVDVVISSEKCPYLKIVPSSQGYLNIFGKM